MSMPQITRRLEFDAGHRLLKHESKCANVHGHRYAVELTVQSAALDQVGRVIDFSVVKEKFGRWLDAAWDHAMVVQSGDPLIDWLVEHKQKHYVLDTAPTAENMVRYLFRIAGSILEPHGVEVIHVRLYETPNCWADARA